MVVTKPSTENNQCSWTLFMTVLAVNFCVLIRDVSDLLRQKHLVPVKLNLRWILTASLTSDSVVHRRNHKEYELMLAQVSDFEFAAII